MMPRMDIAIAFAATMDYAPQILHFGTSGRRGRVVDLTQLEIYLNAFAELQYLQTLTPSEGGIRQGDRFFYAYDLRPSSTQFVPEQGGRGEIAQAIEQAVRDAGMTPVNLGALPTPALTCFALAHGKGSMMITGSHIPFDRNGYKTNSARGELLKKNEAPINARVAEVRALLYAQSPNQSAFDCHGNLKGGSRRLLPITPDAAEAYLRRYTDFFGPTALAGMKLLAYQHSAVGRDLLVDLLRRLGAQVIPAGRSDTFVPIDTEAIDAPQLATISQLAQAAWREHGSLDAVVSTDGDSDRPLVLAVYPAPAGDAVPCHVRFFGGDLLGIVVAEYLEADAVVVPISCNDAIDRGTLKDKVQPKTKIGSPYVIAGMDRARAAGKQAVCGWEANGGFLTGSDIRRNGVTLTALPTRDAILPILAALCSAQEAKASLSARFDRLPLRFSKASLLRNFPRPASLRIVQRFSPADSAIVNVCFAGDQPSLADAAGRTVGADLQTASAVRTIRDSLSTFFSPLNGFGAITGLNYTDGLRIYFANGDVAHVRPSGNADELRIYAVADTQERADHIAALGVAEPDGILRQLEKVA